MDGTRRPKTKKTRETVWESRVELDGMCVVVKDIAQEELAQKIFRQSFLGPFKLYAQDVMTRCRVKREMRWVAS